MGKRVLMLVTNGYRPDPRVHKEAKALLAGGYEVTVAAWDREGSRSPREDLEGVRVRRIRAGRIRGQLSLVFYYPLFLWRALAAAKASRPDAVHAHDLDTLPIGLLISRLRGVPLVFDAHERYSKMIAVDVPASISTAVQKLEDALVPWADLVITINEPMARELGRRARDEVLVIMNCIELPPVSQIRQHENHEVIVLINPVTFEPMRYIEESMEAVSRMEHCTLRIAGTGRLLEAVEKAALENKNIEYLGYLAHNRLLEEYAHADVVLLLADSRNENYRMGAANKMGEAMAFGLPLIASKGVLSGEIVERIGCGIAIDWSEKDFHEAVDRLRDPALRTEMGRKGREAAEKEYNWGLMRHRLQQAYDRMFRERREA